MSEEKCIAIEKLVSEYVFLTCLLKDAAKPIGENLRKILRSFRNSFPGCLQGTMKREEE